MDTVRTGWFRRLGWDADCDCHRGGAQVRQDGSVDRPVVGLLDWSQVGWAMGHGVRVRIVRDRGRIGRGRSNHIRRPVRCSGRRKVVPSLDRECCRGDTENAIRRKVERDRPILRRGGSCRLIDRRRVCFGNVCSRWFAAAERWLWWVRRSEQTE
jgi:hypothetical protein